METQTENAELFIPVITSDSTDDIKLRKRTGRHLIEEMLHDVSLASVIAPFKSNGSPNGHKILDDAAAVRALLKNAPQSQADRFKALELKEFDCVQVFNQAIRRHFEMDKRGKLTGLPSKRIALAAAKSAEAAAA